MSTQNVEPVAQAFDDTALEKIRSGQKLIIYAILLYMPVGGLRGTNPAAAIVLGIPAVVMALVGLSRLTSGLHYTTGKKVFALVLQFIPLVNIVALAILSSRATKILRAAGFKVGWLGASSRASKPLQDGELSDYETEALPVAQRLIAFAKRQWVILFLVLLLIVVLVILKNQSSYAEYDKTVCAEPPLKTVSARNAAMEEGYSINRRYDCIDKDSFAAINRQKSAWQNAHKDDQRTKVSTPTTATVRSEAPRAEQWQLMFVSQIGNTYRDVDSLARSGNRVTVREKVELFKPEHSLIANPPYEYKVFVSTREYDCTANTARTVSQINITANGEARQSEIQVTNATPLIGPYMEKSHDFACSWGAKSN